jgi:hypothetical protein
MNTSNLGSDAQKFFREVADITKLSTAQAPLTTLQVWRRSFSLDTSYNNADLFRSLSLLMSRLERLSEQISNSKVMDDEQKRIASDLVESLQSCIQPENFHRRINDFEATFSTDKLSILGMFSISLRLENAQPTLAAEDAKQIADQIDELGVFVSAAEVEPDLKNLLLKHLAYMAWAVRNFDKLGTDGISEAFGPAVLSARRAAAAEKEDPNNPDEAPRRTIYQRVLDIARKTIKLLEVTNKGLQLIDHIDDDIQGLP